MTINSTPQTVTIAGSDSGGGAGIQADLKTFQTRKVFGMSIITALTAQNTKGVQKSMPVPLDFIAEQFKSLAEDFNIRAAKTGMLANKDVVETVAENYEKYDFGPLIVDPVMIAKGGHTLLENGAVQSVKEKLLPHAYLVTPNIPEAEVLTGKELETKEDIKEAALDFQELGVKNVVIKGGHAEGDKASDYVLLEDGTSFWMHAPRVDTKDTHGTGDTFSSCIASELAKGKDIKEAVQTGKAFIQGAIEQGISVGHGHGPTNHWAELSKNIKITEE